MGYKKKKKNQKNASLAHETARSSGNNTTTGTGREGNVRRQAHAKRRPDARAHKAIELVGLSEHAETLERKNVSWGRNNGPKGTPL